MHEFFLLLDLEHCKSVVSRFCVIHDRLDVVQLVKVVEFVLVIPGVKVSGADFLEERKPLLNVLAIFIKLFALIPWVVDVRSMRDTSASAAAVLPIAVVNNRIVVDQVKGEEFFSLTPIHVKDLRKKVR